MIDDSSPNSIASFVFGVLSIIFYSVVYYPQFYVIYKTKKTDGISIWMLLVWGQADFLSLVGVIVLNLELSLIIIGWYHAFIGFLMTLYTLYYEKGDKVKKYIAGRLGDFDLLSSKLKELITLLQTAKKETINSYRENPQFKAVYGTDLAISLLDDIIKLFK